MHSVVVVDVVSLFVFCFSIEQVLLQNYSKKDEYYLHKNELGIKANFTLKDVAPGFVFETQ